MYCRIKLDYIEKFGLHFEQSLYIMFVDLLVGTTVARLYSLNSLLGGVRDGSTFSSAHHALKALEWEKIALRF